MQYEDGLKWYQQILKCEAQQLFLKSGLMKEFTQYSMYESKTV